MNASAFGGGTWIEVWLKISYSDQKFLYFSSFIHEKEETRALALPAWDVILRLPTDMPIMEGHVKQFVLHII